MIPPCQVRLCALIRLVCQAMRIISLGQSGYAQLFAWPFIRLHSSKSITCKSKKASAPPVKSGTCFLIPNGLFSSDGMSFSDSMLVCLFSDDIFGMSFSVDIFGMSFGQTITRAVRMLFLRSRLLPA
jgi:hypothetical protein